MKGQKRLSVKYRSLPISYIRKLFPSIKTTSKNINFRILNMVDGGEVKNALTFAINKVFLERALKNPMISGIFISPELSDFFNKKETEKIALISENPTKHFFQLHNDLYENTEFYRGKYNKETQIPTSCKISPHTIIEEGVIVGEDCVFKERCVIKSGTIIGNGVTIKEGAIIGGEVSEVKMIDGKYVSIRHDSNVIIEDEAEIGINAIISRGIYGRDTIIGESTRICDSVFISHCCQIGKNNFIASGVNISGSVEVGDNVWIGPGVITTNGIRIGDGANITIGSVVIKDVNPKEKVAGNFAIPHSTFMYNWTKSKKK